MADVSGFQAHDLRVLPGLSVRPQWLRRRGVVYVAGVVIVPVKSR